MGLLLLSAPCLACTRLVALRLHCHALPPLWRPSLLLSLRLSLHLQRWSLKLIVLLVAAAHLRREGLQHGAVREAKLARRLGGVEAIAVETKVPVRRQLLKAEQRIAQRQRRIDEVRLHVAAGRLHQELIRRRSE